MILKESHHLTVPQALEHLRSHAEQGVSEAEARERLERHGPNELQEKPRPGFWHLLGQQFNNFLVIILIVAAVVSLALGEWVDAGAILLLVALNSLVGVIQESKAEAALAALKKMAAPNAQVIRGGRQATIPSRELVPGDLVLVEAGNYVPADLRLVETVNLRIEEASLTGESVPVDKDAALVLDKDIPLGDRHNSAFMSTVVTRGRGRGLVTATGMHTQIGLIAEMLQTVEEEATPLQIKLNQLARTLGTLCLAICGVIFLYGLIRDTHIAALWQQGLAAYLGEEKRDIIELFMTAISLAIAAVPEGLPAVVTICLAIGMQRMIRRHALIRRLPAVETLGCATVICTDKTGTLTQNEMTVVQAWSGGRSFQVTGEGYAPAGAFLADGRPCEPGRDPALTVLLHAALLCNDARLEQRADDQGRMAWRMIGDPTEGALVTAAGKAGLRRDEVDKTLPRVREIPFDSDRKRMTTLHERRGNARPGFDGQALVAFVKGAPDLVLDLCGGILADGAVRPLSAEQKREILDRNQAMARQALRVLALAYRPLEAIPEPCTPETVERDLVFLGLLGMIDPARPEVKAAVREAHEAGLKTVMVTGDYKDTAEAIARDIGLLVPGGKVLTGADLDRLSPAELAEAADDLNVCCRVSPQHKTKIVDALQARGQIVAMTGDGVNDAPALKRSNIGVAMGITGTDVSKEAADMVLTDDNFASIVAAVEEGRIIYANIRKFVFFLISCNIGEILIIFLSMLFGLPIPLRPVQLLLLNLVTDGAPALALGVEKGDPDIMKRPPRPAREPVINRTMWIVTLIQASVMTAAVLAAYGFALGRYPGDLARAQTVAFVALSMSELVRVFTIRSERQSVFRIGVFSNRHMVGAVLLSAAIVLATVYVPFLQTLVGTVPLSGLDWLWLLPFIPLDSVAAEFIKFVIRRTDRSAGGSVQGAA